MLVFTTFSTMKILPEDYFKWYVVSILTKKQGKHPCVSLWKLLK